MTVSPGVTSAAHDERFTLRLDCGIAPTPWPDGLAEDKNRQGHPAAFGISDSKLAPAGIVFSGSKSYSKKDSEARTGSSGHEFVRGARPAERSDD